MLLSKPPMKQFIALLLCIVSTAAVYAGGVQNFVANVSGTVYQQPGFGDEAKLVATPLNAKRIFTEFGVSQDDYALVVSVGGDEFLALVPKSSGSGLPVINVINISFSDYRAAFNGKTGAGVAEFPIIPFGNTNIFNNLRGSILANLKLSTDTDKIQRFSASITGSSGTGAIKMDEPKSLTPKGGVSTPNTLFKIKVSKGAPFTQTAPL